MSDIIKWGLLATAVISLVAVIVTLPIVNFFGSSSAVVSEGIGVILDITSPYLYTARAFINIFLNSWGRKILTGLITYLFFKWFLVLNLKVTTWVYHFIFK